MKKKDSLEKVRELGLEQTAGYAKTCGVTEAHLLIFDRDGTQGWREEPLSETVRHDGVEIQIWGF